MSTENLGVINTGNPDPAENESITKRREREEVIKNRIFFSSPKSTMVDEDWASTMPAGSARCRIYQESQDLSWPYSPTHCHHRRGLLIGQLPALLRH
jgi:hypothetical protein